MKLQKALCVFLTGYAKRMMESRYDALMSSTATRPVMELTKGGRYGIEAALYALNAVLDQKWQPNSPVGMALKDIVKDAPSEIGKRLVNGFREQVVHSSGTGEPGKFAVEKVLLDLDDETLGVLLKWCADSDPKERSRQLSVVAAMTPEQLARLAQLPPEQFRLLMELNKPPGKKKRELPATIRKDVDAAKARLQEQARLRAQGRKE